MERSGKRKFAARAVMVAATALAVAGAGLAQSAQAIPPEIARLQLSPNTGAVGASVVARGSFIWPASPTGIASESVALYFGRRLVATGATDSHGVFSILFSVPVVSAGRYQVTAYGRSTQRVATATFSIVVSLSAEARPVTLVPARSTRARPVTLVPARSTRARPVTHTPSQFWRGRPVAHTPTPPLLPQLQLRPDRGSPGSGLDVAARGLPCARVELWFTDSAGTRTALAVGPLDGGRVLFRSSVPRSAAEGMGTVSVRGVDTTSPCAASAGYRVCTLCDEGHDGLESKAIG